MAKLGKRFVFSFLLISTAYAQNDLPSWQTKLHNILFKDYHRSVPPVHNGAVNVHLGFSLRGLDLDETSSKLSVHVISKRIWTDKRITWDPADYNDTTRVFVNDWYVWKPDIEMWNSGKSVPTVDADVEVSNDGTMMQFQFLQIEFKCRMDFRFFPYDEQMCEMIFGSWHYNEGVVNLTETSYADLSYYEPAADFELLEITAKRHSIQYPCCPEKYVDVTYTFRLRRKSKAYSVKLVVPAVLSGFMVLATFLLPPGSHEKITLCGMLFLGILLQLIYVHDIVPASGETMLADFLVFALFIDGFATVIGVISYNVHMRSPVMQTPSLIQTEGDDNDLKIRMPVDRKREILRHLDLACFVLFTIVFIVGMAIIVGRHN